MADRIGVWLIGARGGLATTVIAGTRAMARGLAPRLGLATDAAECAPLALADPTAFVFGGHDVRAVSLRESADEVRRDTGSLTSEWIAAVGDDLDRADAEIRPGTLLNCGDAVARLADPAFDDAAQGTLRDRVARLAGDLRAFGRRNGLDRTIVVNLASTEPPLEPADEHGSLAAFDAMLDVDRRDRVRASLLYAYAALDAGCPFVNFTPSNAPVVPAIVEMARARGMPLGGSDGKTGETLVKTALAPMFRHRALRVLAWQGYNILGDRDGEVLADAAHRESKVRSKDQALGSILGYPLHTHVGIDFVPSLKDLKTAWDFIHFEGFLGHRMSMQFIWQGCDAVLAAPLVLDLARWMDHAARIGARGPQRHLAAYFKNPLECREHDFHRQWDLLLEYVRRHGGDSAA